MEDRFGADVSCAACLHGAPESGSKLPHSTLSSPASLREPGVRQLVRLRVAEGPPGVHSRNLQIDSHGLFLVFSCAHVAAPIAHFISFEMGNLVERF